MATKLGRMDCNCRKRLYSAIRCFNKHKVEAIVEDADITGEDMLSFAMSHISVNVVLRDISARACNRCSNRLLRYRWQNGRSVQSYSFAAQSWR